MILIDTSAWIDHLRRSNPIVKNCLEEDVAAVNDVILLELIPFLKEHSEIDALKKLHRFRCLEEPEDWELLIQYQQSLMRQGINGVSIADLFIIHTSKVHGIALYTLDNIFSKASKILDFKMFPNG